ncbi:tetratricopeptide repeat protein [Mycolicibacterium komossense]|uniref:Mce protein n=1 Tax=Mycolicibacterium komossense TaxID=1779 RepID=A0ABT3C5M8_9MYCO|nr:tetratricopeptide repeat protein [Mycolicibacterium komossense]MCV7224506.1 Mce protein [Mycolicibacterium komossense]
MADDAAAPEGELSESTHEELSSRADVTASSDGSPESPSKADAEPTDAVDVNEDAEDTDLVEAEPAPAESKPGMSHVRVATIIGLVVVLALGGLVGWLGFRAYESQNAERQRELFLQVGRQGALNLTTIDFEHADADVQRILDSATDTFYDDFSKRSQPFVDVVKQAQSKSVGTITSAGLESEDNDGGQVLVAVTVKTSNAGAAEQQPRAWRMRIMVKKTGDDEAKVSNVEFVP